MALNNSSGTREAQLRQLGASIASGTTQDNCIAFSSTVIRRSSSSARSSGVVVVTFGSPS
jgi:hypothetical protein